MLAERDANERLPVSRCDILCDMMDVPVADHERFANPPLKALVGQIRFPAVLRITDHGFIAPFQEQLRNEYPELLDETQFGIVAGPAGAVQMEPQRQLRLANFDKSWSVVLAPTSLTLEAGVGYTDFGEFVSRFERIWAAAVEHIGPTRRVQQGLRYINHIEGDLAPSDWRTLVNPGLLGAVGGPELGENIEQWVSDYRIARPDGTLVLKHGFVRAGIGNAPGYLLDFDYFTQLEPETLTAAAIASTFRSFHNVIYPLFIWCVTPAALDLFRSPRTGAQ